MTDQTTLAALRDEIAAMPSRDSEMPFRDMHGQAVTYSDPVMVVSRRAVLAAIDRLQAAGVRVTGNALLALADEWCDRTAPDDVARLNVRAFAVWPTSGMESAWVTLGTSCTASTESRRHVRRVSATPCCGMQYAMRSCC